MHRRQRQTLLVFSAQRFAVRSSQLGSAQHDNWRTFQQGDFRDAPVFLASYSE